MNAIQTPTPTFAQRFSRNIRSAPLLIAGLIGLLASPLLHAQSTIQFAASVYLVNEDDGEVVVTVQRANDLDTVVTVDYATSDGTAVAGEDYVATSGTLTFAAGQTVQILSVVIINDGLVEGTESFLIILSNPGAGAVLGPRASASVRIRDNDTGPHFTSSTIVTVQDIGTLWIRVHRGDDGDQPVTVGYATQDGTAVAGQHYEAASGTLRFEADEFIASIPVVILNAGLEEVNKTFQIQLADASSGGVGQPALASVRIQDPTPMLYAQPSPVSQSVSLGAHVRIQVSAKGALMQWQRRVDDGEFEDIPGATSTVLEWGAATVDLTGDYRFLVGDASGHSIISEIATVQVDPTFTKITEGPHVTDLGCSGFGGWADFDNDGYADLFVEREVLGASAIYRNNGDGTFSRLPSPPGLAGKEYFGNWCDWDNDGNQDLYVKVDNNWHIGYGDGQGDFDLGLLTSNARNWTAHADYDRDGWIDIYSATGNSYFHNQGNREFVTYRGTTDLGPAGVYTHGGPCSGDFDDDGWPDLFVPSLRTSRSYLLRNEGNGQFTAVDNLITQTTGPAFQAAWGDYDNDGRLDLFVASIGGVSTLYRNLGNGEFEIPDGAPTLEGTHNFVAWADYDNDGFLDLWVSGYMSGNKLSRNNGDGSFTRVTIGSIVNERPLNDAGTYQVAWFDSNNNGFLDLYIMNGDDNLSISTANQFYRNNGNDNAWLTVRLVGTVSNRDAVGAKVRALATYAGEARWQRRDITGGSLGNGNHRYAHFGLGDATQVDVLRIEWPSGIVQELTDVEPRQILTVTEPPRLIPRGVGAFQIQCWINQSFEVQASTDLVTWSTIDTVTNQTGTLVYEDAGAGQYECRYYRVRSK